MTEKIGKPQDGENEAVRRLWVACFPEGGPKYTGWFFRYVYRMENTLCLFEGGELVSALQMIPYRLSLRGNKTEVNTLTGVSTDPTRRNRGFARALMAAALGDMASRGLGFTFLYPFDHGFYERLGWAACSAALEYRLPAADLPDAPPEGYAVREATERDIPAFSDVYDRWSAGRNCFSVRDGAAWLKRIGENDSCEGFALLAEYHGKPRAYAIAEVENGEINAYELASQRPDATLAILSALKPRGLPVRWIAPEDDRAYLLPGGWTNAVRLQPHVMFRVTDVPLAFTQASPAYPGDFSMEITGDAMRPENNGIYWVHAGNRKTEAGKVDARPQFSCGMGALARILTGYMDAEEAVETGLAEGETKTIELLRRIYPKQRNFLFELY